LVNSQSQGWVLNQIGLTEEKIPKLSEKGKKLAIKFINLLKLIFSPEKAGALKLE
jgi:DNA-binding Xre family transcriptional regulator